jgi:hypothetical protein
MRDIMSVQAFKMITGEDVVAEVVSESDTKLHTKNPAVVIMQRAEDGRIGVGLQPLVPIAKNGEVQFSISALSAFYEIETQMINEYNRIFGNGIVIASANEMPR